ncbi:5'-nucleotidase [Halomonas cupida]|uniref:5'-nucleotidase n=1 Tax=Halomonas cupida TaxID=44933 RepID=A0A1M7GZW7_9GAMM|nr:5'-nucleotidase [Halomonas cupida]GEN24806.1 5'-nucleotidase [Halomonas cupida]SHM21855.1 5'-nucleotidase [Halomonas cupida]
MPYELADRLVIGLASSALFDLSASDRVFREQGEEAYRLHQREHESETLAPGVAFAFIRKLLSLNELAPEDPLIEVVLLSRNDPDTGLRVMRSIEHHQLGITRAIFLQGRYPHRFIPALNISLFLSANREDVDHAIAAGYPAGRVMPSRNPLVDEREELHIAFDFDGVLASDASEMIFQKQGLEAFLEHEREHAEEPAAPGVLADLIRRLAVVQQREKDHVRDSGGGYQPRMRVSIVTARNAPAHERVVHTLRDWGVTVNEAYFLGGIAKHHVLGIIQPDIFFDDQSSHLTDTSDILPSVHVPVGRLNSPPTLAEGEED